jgi:small GTP-binding protein
LEILDTAGQVRRFFFSRSSHLQETFSAMRELYMANGEGFALIYSITSALSFAEVEKIHKGIVKHKDTSQVPIVLVGNKKDLEAKREVPTAKAKALSTEWGCDFLEASAKTDTNIREIFNSLIDQVWGFSGGPPRVREKRGCQLL